MENYRRQSLTLAFAYVLIVALLVLGFSTRAQAQELPTVERDGGESAEAAAPAEVGTGSYLIQPGDTLSRIAVQLGTSVDYLASYNSMADPDVIYSGQTLSFELQEGFRPPVAAEDNSEEAMMEGEEGAGEEEEEGKRPDEPDKAAALRFQQNKNEKGVIPRGALVRAAKKAKSMKHKPVPGTKGISRTSTQEASQPSSTDSTQPSSTDTTQGTAGTVQPSTANIDRNLWKWRGPGNVGGRLRSIVIHPTNPQIMWAGSVGGGIWKTENGGASWRPLDDFMTNLAVATLVIDPKNPNILYAGTGEGFYSGDVLRGAGVFKSTDGGANWNQLSSTATPDFQWVNRLAISPSNSQVLLAATRTGIWRSSDGGATWTPKLPANQGFLQVAFNPNDGTKVVASGKYGRAYYSTNGGYTWTSATKPWGTGQTINYPNGSSENYDARVELSYAPSNPNIVYASVNQARQYTDGNYYAGVIYKSTDGGRNYSATGAWGYLENTQGWYDNAIWVSPTNPNFLIFGGVDLFRSTDGGATLTRISQWQSSPNYSAHGDQHAIVSSPNYNGTTNKTIFFGNDGGIYKTQDASTVAKTSGWQELNNNLGVTQFYGGAGNITSGTIVGGAQDNGSLTGKGDTEGWTKMSGGDGGFSAADPSNSNYFYGEYVNLQIHRSTNGGTSSSYIYPGITDAGTNRALFIAPFILDPNNPNTMLAGGRSMWRSTNVKAATPSWTSIKQPVGTSYYDNISAIAVAPGNSNIIWVGDANSRVYKTTNGTSATPTWTRMDQTTPYLPNRYVTRITIDPRNSNIVYATFGGFSPDNVWRTTDGGSTWREITGSGDTGLPDAPVRSLVIHPNNSNWLYVGTEVGVFASEDGGAHWSTATDGPANMPVDELFWQGTRLFAATHGRGMYETDTQAVRPANDNFANAQGLTGANATAAGTNANASKETGEPDHWTGNPAGKSVWYKWTPQANGTATIDTAGSAFDTVLAVYTGSAVNTLTQIDQNDDGPNLGQQSKLDFQATAGTTYRIAVDGYDNGLGNESGNIKLNLASDALPVDTTNPTATLTAPANNAVVKDTAVTISADASDNVGVSKVEFLVDGQLVATDNSAPYSTSWDSTAKSDGFANITARAIDAAGNTGISGIRKVAVNNTTPNTTITGGPADGSTTANTTASFTFSSTENDSTFRCKLDDTAYANCASPKDYASLADGSHTFQVKAVGTGGEANDSDATPASRTWTVSTTTGVTCMGKAADIVITTAGKTTNGTPADDVIVGSSGDDTINGLGGNDTICGGEGYDSISGGPGNDTLDGGTGDDALYYRSASTGVNVNLATGTATGEGSDTLYSFTEVYGSRFSDTLMGDGSFNYLNGYEGNDTITGGPGNDWMLGGDDADTINSRDGAADTGAHWNAPYGVDCGAGTDKDKLTTDAGLDKVNPECDQDTAAPKGTIKINAGRAYTRSPSVNLSLSASDPAPASGVSSMRLMNDGGSWSGWQPYATSKSWTLRKANGTRAVYVQYKDRADNVSTLLDRIVLDTTKPRIGAILPRHRSIIKDTTPTIRATVKDNTNLKKSNIKLYVAGKRIANSKFSYSASTDKLLYNSPRLTKGKKVVKIVARDAAGNPGVKNWYFTIR